MEDPKRSLEDAEDLLRKSDAVMNDLISRHGPCTLNETKYSPFHLLVRSIISQQLSWKAADTISNRLESIVGSPFLPFRIIRTSDHILRSAGLSTKKLSCIREISRMVIEEDLSFENMDKKSDEEIVNLLTKVSGIGRWTAEMFLIFGLKRLDIFSYGDAGLRRAISSLYSDDSENSADVLRISENWRPYRSVASWYLWRSLDSPERK